MPDPGSSTQTAAADQVVAHLAPIGVRSVICHGKAARPSVQLLEVFVIENTPVNTRQPRPITLPPPSAGRVRTIAVAVAAAAATPIPGARALHTAAKNTEQLWRTHINVVPPLYHEILDDTAEGAREGGRFM